MKTRIDWDEDFIEISNDGFDNPNFVDITIFKKLEDGKKKYVAEVTVPISELFYTISAFKEYLDNLQKKYG